MNDGGSLSHLKLVGGNEKSLDELRAELESLKYENQKLKTINDVLVKRVELGWGNFSTAYSSFQRAAMLTEQVASKAKALEQTRTELGEAQFHLDRTQAERDLTRQRISDLIETIPDAVALFDESRVLVLANASFYSFWADTGASIQPGITRLVELGRLAVTHGLVDRRSRTAERAMAGRGPAGSSVFRMADGRWLQLAERSTADGGLVVVYTDVTGVKSEEVVYRERAAAAHDTLLENMLENLPQGVVLVDAHGGLRACNKRFRQLIGMSRGDLDQEVSIIALIRSSRIGEAMADISALWSGCDPGSTGCQRELTLADGQVLDIRSNPLFDGGYVITFTDISDRNRDARLLREAERRRRLMTDALPALISYINREGVYEFANRSFEDWFDRPRDRVEGAKLEDVLGATEYENHRKYISKALSGQAVSFEIEQVLPDGRQCIFTKSYVPHRGDDSSEVQGFFALEQDVTEQRRTASALKHAYRHMEQRVFERTRELSDLNDKLHAEVEERTQIERHLLEATREARQASESKVKFMAAAGHDLLQPLNAARLFASAMLDEDLDPKVNRLTASLSRSLDDVESIITTLVDISKLEAGVVEAAPESFCADDLLAALADEFSVLAADAGLGFHYKRSRAVVHSDSQLLARILRNLLTNALRYTDQGRIVLGCRRRPDCLDIEVADTGIGIEEDQLQLIFGEFQRAPGAKLKDERGLGLGLAIVEKLSGVLGCSVSVRSFPSRGSVFTVHVPYGDLSAKPAAVVDAVDVTDLDMLQGQRILVVDNDPSILEGMQNLLEKWGCDVATARNLSDMDDHLVAGFDPTLAVLDYQLDEQLTGFAVATVLQDRLEVMPPVVMITANYSLELRTQAAQSGFVLMHKPVRPHKLRLAMSRLLAG